MSFPGSSRFEIIHGASSIAAVSFFITFEGIEGCGKSTQSRLLVERLTERGRQALLTREPGGTELTLHIRELLADPDGELDRKAELFLFLADRAQHVTKVIKPALAEGAIVVSDRYSDSTLAYQGYGRGHDLDWLTEINERACQSTLPDLTLWLDCSVETGLERAVKLRGGPSDRFENEPLDFHRNVHGGFVALHQRFPERIVQIDAEASPEAVARAIDAQIAERLP